MTDETATFLNNLRALTGTLTSYVSTNAGDWSIKGFVDIREKVYTISFDSKIISKLLELQLFPFFKQFADDNGYTIILAEKQNWYPDLSFVSKSSPSIKFAVDIKTT